MNRKCEQTFIPTSKSFYRFASTFSLENTPTQNSSTRRKRVTTPKALYHFFTPKLLFSTKWPTLRPLFDSSVASRHG